MKFVVAFIFFLTTLFSQARTLNDFINITKSGTYDFGGEVLSVEDLANTPAIVIGDAQNQVPSFTVSNVILKNVVIFGNRHKQTSEYNSRFSYLRNNGITIRGAVNVTVENVWVIGARSGGLVCEKHCKNITVRNSYFLSSHFDGLAACETSDSLFEDIAVNNNDYAGISLDWNVNNCTFRKIYSYGNKDWTAFQRSSKGIIYDQIISKNNGGGIFIARNTEANLATATGVINGSVFSDVRPHFIESCCELIQAPIAAQ